MGGRGFDAVEAAAERIGDAADRLGDGAAQLGDAAIEHQRLVFRDMIEQESYWNLAVSAGAGLAAGGPKGAVRAVASAFAIEYAKSSVRVIVDDPEKEASILRAIEIADTSMIVSGTPRALVKLARTGMKNESLGVRDAATFARESLGGLLELVDVSGDGSRRPELLPATSKSTAAMFRDSWLDPSTGVRWKHAPTTQVIAPSVGWSIPYPESGWSTPYREPWSSAPVDRGVRLPSAERVRSPRTSIVDYLSGLGSDASYSSREELARQYGFVDYAGTAEENAQLLGLLRAGVTPAKSTAGTPPPPASVGAPAKATTRVVGDTVVTERGGVATSVAPTTTAITSLDVGAAIRIDQPSGATRIYTNYGYADGGYSAVNATRLAAMPDWVKASHAQAEVIREREALIDALIAAQPGKYSASVIEYMYRQVHRGLQDL